MNLFKPKLDDQMSQTYNLKNNKAEADIFLTGAGIHDYCFKRKDGTCFKPFAEANWQHKYRNLHNSEVPRHIQLLGGEWPCVPFGTTRDDTDHHGFGSNNIWQIIEQENDSITLKIEYPTSHVIRHLIRKIRLNPLTGFLDVSLEVEAKQKCCLPIGIHPIFKIPTNAGGFKITPPKFLDCASAPKEIAPGASQLGYSEKITADSDVWNALNIYGEELVQAWQTDGQLTLHYPNESCDVTLNWNKEDLPHCLIWVANPGLSRLPIGQGFTGIGIEPTSSFFDLNDSADAHSNLHGLSSNSFGTLLEPNKTWKTEYQISVQEK